MTLRAHKRIGLAYVPAPLLPQGHLGETVPSVDPSGQVLRVYGGRVVVFSTATRVHDLRLERPSRYLPQRTSMSSARARGAGRLRDPV
jgi:hypothetical protein